MAYNFYLDGVLLPVTPSKIDFQIKNQNKTMTLLDEGEINVLKLPGLTEVSFTALLPRVKYRFATYEDEQYGARYFLDKLEELKLSRKAFNFKINRSRAGESLSETDMLVSLEDYTFNEDYKNGFDVEVKIKLKQYREYAAKIVEDYIINGARLATVKNVRSTASAPKVETYTVQKGDTLWAIAKRFLGDGAKCWNLAKLNNISNPNRIQIGQVIKIADVAASYPAHSNANVSTSNNKANDKDYILSLEKRLDIEKTLKESGKSLASVKNTGFLSGDINKALKDARFEKGGGLSGSYGGNSEIISTPANASAVAVKKLTPVQPKYDWSQYKKS